MKKAIVTGLWSLLLATVLTVPAFAQELVVGGQVVGVQISTEGVVVAGFSEIETESGTVSPAQSAGVHQGDLITAVNGSKVADAQEVISAVGECGGESVCSSKIRECLSEGSIDKANEYLSRPYFMTGTVVEGRQVGRTIGYPTANLMLDDASKLVPKDGVYAVRVVVNDVHAYNAIMNIGTRPTLNDGRGRTIEIHLLDFSGSLYGARMRVEFVGFIRDERKFDNFEQLKHQISIDKADAIKIFR